MSLFTTNPTPPRPHRSLVILVADDDPDYQLRFREWLEGAGHRTLKALSGVEAIRTLHQQPVDLVITEVIMPDGDGLEVLLELKKMHSEIPRIAVSGGGRYLPAHDCLRVARGLGAQEALLKPLSSERVLLAVAQATATARFAPVV